MSGVTSCEYVPYPSEGGRSLRIIRVNEARW